MLLTNLVLYEEKIPKLKEKEMFCEPLACVWLQRHLVFVCDDAERWCIYENQPRPSAVSGLLAVSS